jgi:hypothetical protein
VDVVETKELSQSLCALWDVLIEAQDQIATIINTIGKPRPEEDSSGRAWLIRPGTSPVEINLLDYYAATKGVQRDPGE